MNDLPPIAFDLPSIQPEERVHPELPRVWIGWAFLILIFGMLITMSFAESSGKKLVSPQKKSQSQQKMILVQMAAKAMQGKNAPKVKAFESVIDDLLPESKTSNVAQKLRVALRVEDGQEPFAEDLKNLASSKLADDVAFAQLYQNKNLKKAEAEPLLAKLDDKDLGEKIARSQFKEKFGDENARKNAFPAGPALRLGAFGALGCTAFLVGSGLLMWFITQRMAGKFQPFGLPMDSVQPWLADRLALAASFVMLCYVLVGTLVEYAPVGAPKFVAALPFAAIFLSIAVIGKVPIAGYRFTLESLGINQTGLGKRLLMGFCGSLCMIPILIVASIIALSLASGLPGGAHPIGEQLLDNMSVSKLLLTLLLASVIAPIWEEFVFRGLMFPALAGLLKSRFWGAAVSSFVFAAIHPQGPAGIPILWTIAMGLCYMSYQTKSLVPSMVMHCLNNTGALLLVAVLGKDLL